jgi:NAD-dependent DNA ligase
MSASNLFGRGFSEKRIELILEGVPDILTSVESVSQKIQRVSQIKGMGEKSAEAFIINIEVFLAFLQEMGIKASQQNPKQLKKEENHKLFQKTIVLSGTREKEILEKLKSVGAKVGANITKNTFCLIVKDKTDKTGKYQDAEKYGIPIVDVGEFQKKYM